MARRDADARKSPKVQAVQKALLDAVDTQLREGKPPVVVETFERLQSEGHSEGMAKQLIGITLLMELNDMMKDDTPLDEPRFAAALRRLPKLTLD